MELYKRFLVIIAAIACAASVVCGVIIAKSNTERRLYGAQNGSLPPSSLFYDLHGNMCNESASHLRNRRGFLR